MPYATVKHIVEEALSPALLLEMQDFLVLQPKISKLWGAEQTTGFARKMITLSLYKDLSGKGFDKIISSVDPGFRINTKSFQHNVKLIRKLLQPWARSKIRSDGLDSWKISAQGFPHKSKFPDVNLVMDSTDFRLSGKATMSRKDPFWSYKLNGPGQRFQALVDGTGRIQALWGGYSPKIYDGDWVKMMAEYLIRDFPGARIVADTHYETANRSVADVSSTANIYFYCTVSKPRGRKRKRADTTASDPSSGATVLTKEQEAWNRRLSHIRARVESPFGLIKRKWKALGTVFFEDCQQHDYLVRIAVAVHNCKRTPQAIEIDAE